MIVANVGGNEPGLDHPAVFPLALAEQLVKTFSQAGDLVLDPSVGAGRPFWRRKGVGVVIWGSRGRRNTSRLLWGGCGDEEVGRIGCRRFTVKHRSRINFSFAPERIERLKATPEFQEIATSNKEGKARDEEIRYGKSVQEDIVLLLERHGRQAGLRRPGRVPQAA